MNPYVLLGAVLFWVASVGGAGWYGIGVGHDQEVAKQSAVNTAIQETRDAAQQGAADAIARNRPINTTIVQKATTLVRDDRRYVDCTHAPGVLDSINQALTGRAEPAGGVQLPGTVPAK